MSSILKNKQCFFILLPVLVAPTILFYIFHTPTTTSKYETRSSSFKNNVNYELSIQTDTTKAFENLSASIRNSQSTTETLPTKVRLTTNIVENSTIPVDYSQIDVESSKPRKILTWTPFFESVAYIYYLYRNHVISIDGNLTCEVTNNRSEIENADAVIFHGRDFNSSDLPETHKSNQLWVYFLLESSVHSGCNESCWKKVNEIGINWYMGYHRTNSHSFFPYGKFIENKPDFNTTEISLKVKMFVNSFSSKPKDAVWLVSHCLTQSKRLHLVHKMKQQGLNVDIFGKCGTKLLIPKDNETAWDNFYNQYRFYISFENSLCDDYVSEKAYDAYKKTIKYGLIPVVYGGANYSEFLPQGSYVDVGNFTKIAELVKFLKLLSKPESIQVIEGYYQWMYHYHLPYEHNFYQYNGWETMCRNLWNTTKVANSPPLTDVEPLLGKCHAPSLV